MLDSTFILTAIAILISAPGAIVSVLTLTAYVHRKLRQHKHREPSNPNATHR